MEVKKRLRKKKPGVDARHMNTGGILFCSRNEEATEPPHYMEQGKTFIGIGNYIIQGSTTPSA
jgi:hypothetical protein